MFLKVSHISQENTFVGVSFKAFRRKTLLRINSNTVKFLVKFAKFLRTPILKNIYEQLLLNGEMYTSQT